MKFKVGDRVKIKEDLSHRGSYKVYVSRYMEEYKGKEATIVGLEGNTYSLDIDAGNYFWSEDTLEPIKKKAIEYYQNEEISFSVDFDAKKILKALVVEETVKERFTKSDLRDGDIVTYRDGSKGIKNGAHLQKIGNSAIFASLLDYTEKLKQKENRYKNLDIIKVERPVKYVTAFERVEEILDEAEREYLKAVIKPFRNKVKYIQKVKVFMNNEAYIEIVTKDNDTACLTCFDQDKMYKGMKPDVTYTLEELGL